MRILYSIAITAQWWHFLVETESRISRVARATAASSSSSVQASPDSVEEIADAFALTPSDVRWAVACENSLRAA